MTSLLGRMLRLFPESVPLEDVFTEAVARLFERRPGLCLAWLREAGLLATGSAAGADEGYVRVSTQRRFGSLKHHGTASRPDLMIEVYRQSEGTPASEDAATDVVMVESKIGSKEVHEQLRRYAEHLERMTGFRGKTLAYVTRAHDPKDWDVVLGGLGGDVRFEQLRWHDFYRFLQRTTGEDALVEEVMVFMEEQGMAKSYRFTAADLATLSGVPRAFEIMEETLGGEVKAELESFAGNRSRHETVNVMLSNNVRYVVWASVSGWDLSCYLGYRLRTSDGYPLAYVTLHLQPGAEGSETSVAALRKVAHREGWEGHGLEEPKPWARVRRTTNLADVLREEDHVAALQRFFVRSVRELGEELAAFEKRLAQNKDVFEELVRGDSALELDSTAFGGFITRFAVRGWDSPALLAAEDWTPSRRILLFEFWNKHDGPQLKLILGPGPDRVRGEILDVARANPEMFDAPRNYVDTHYELLSLTLAQREAGKETDDREFETKLRDRWAQFVEEDLPRIDAALREGLKI